MIFIWRHNSDSIRSSNSKIKSAKKVRSRQDAYIHVQNKFEHNKNKIGYKEVHNLALHMDHQGHPPNLKNNIYTKALHNFFQFILNMQYLLL